MKTITTLVLLCSTLSAASQFKCTTVGGTSSTGETGFVCLGGNVFNKDAINTESETDYANLVIPVGTGCTHYLHSSLDVPAAAGTHAGFRVAGANIGNLLSGMTVATYQGSTLQEQVSGSELISVLEGTAQNIYFQTTKVYDAVRISFAGLASAAYSLNIYEGYGAQYPPVLPVYFQSLTAAPLKGGWQLSCTLTSTENIRSIAAEGSADGRRFGPVPAVRRGGAGKFTLEVPADESRFYRLRIDTDAKTYYSSILRVTLDRGLHGLTASLGGGRLSLRMEDVPRGTYSLELLDAGGRTRYRKAVQSAGSLQLQESLPLNEGIYYLRILGTEGRAVRTLLATSH